MEQFRTGTERDVKLDPFDEPRSSNEHVPGIWTKDSTLNLSK